MVASWSARDSVLEHFVIHDTHALGNEHVIDQQKMSPIVLEASERCLLTIGPDVD